MRVSEALGVGEPRAGREMGHATRAPFPRSRLEKPTLSSLVQSSVASQSIVVLYTSYSHLLVLLVSPVDIQ